MGDKTNTIFNSQNSCVLKIPGKDLYIACADRWRPGEKNVTKSRWFYRFVKLSARNPGFKKYVKVDLELREAQPLPGEKRWSKDNTWCSDYVWLPVEWIGGKPVLRWYDEWRVEDYR